ncbi:MAG: PadR family transcriptional regulator [Candidatus Geothermarchaeales archaeon]
MSGLREDYGILIDLMILDVLEGRSMSGYGVIQEVHERQHILISPSTLYPILARLEGEGLISSSIGKGSGGKNYSLTYRGRKILEKMRMSLAKIRREKN